MSVYDELEKIKVTLNKGGTLNYGLWIQGKTLHTANQYKSGPFTLIFWQITSYSLSGRLREVSRTRHSAAIELIMLTSDDPFRPTSRIVLKQAVGIGEDKGEIKVEQAIVKMTKFAQKAFGFTPDWRYS